MTGSNDKLLQERTQAVFRRATAPAHVMEAVCVVRSFLERMRKEPKDPNENVEWIK